jgi:hypothetical protein
VHIAVGLATDDTLFSDAKERDNYKTTDNYTGRTH